MSTFSKIGVLLAMLAVFVAALAMAFGLAEPILAWLASPAGLVVAIVGVVTVSVASLVLRRMVARAEHARPGAKSQPNRDPEAPHRADENDAAAEVEVQREAPKTQATSGQTGGVELERVVRAAITILDSDSQEALLDARLQGLIDKACKGFSADERNLVQFLVASPTQIAKGLEQFPHLKPLLSPKITPEFSFRSAVVPSSSYHSIDRVKSKSDPAMLSSSSRR